ncbi:MAG TPA: hypothetical protein VIH90_01335 [Candidatus Saccharimonadales bacterium]
MSLSRTPEVLPVVRIPHLHVESSIQDGHGSFTFIMSRQLLDDFIPSSELEAADDRDEFYNNKLRELCIMHCNHDHLEHRRESLENDRPGSVKLVVKTPEGLVFDSEDLGYNLVKRLATKPDPNAEDLLDPTYSDVDVELRVFDMPESGYSHMGLLALSQVVRHTVLFPPQLA